MMGQNDLYSGLGSPGMVEFSYLDNLGYSRPTGIPHMHVDTLRWNTVASSAENTTACF